jgi:hypothetical protein
MEIALLPQNAIRVKGKHTTFIIDPVDAAAPYAAGLFLRNEGKVGADSVAITGPGEYEIGGIKVSGIKNKDANVYSLSVDGIDILIGDLSVVEKVQHKVKEHQLVLLLAENEADASFITGLATNVLLLYGAKAREVIQKFAKEGMNETNKFQVTKEKLPLEMQTVLLA